jgi:hypothetical protein
MHPARTAQLGDIFRQDEDELLDARQIDRGAVRHLLAGEEVRKTAAEWLFGIDLPA